MSEINDQDIINQVLGGDTDAFSALIEKYHDRVFRYVYSRCNNRDEAFDMAQDIFVMAFQSLKTFRGESKFATWLYSIMVNYCKNYIKKSRRNNVIPINNINNDDYKIQISDERQNTEEDVINRDSLRIVKEELFNLSSEYKEVLVLRDIEGLSYNDISGILGISLTNVKVRIHRGRELLKTRLQSKGLI